MLNKSSSFKTNKTIGHNAGTSSINSYSMSQTAYFLLQISARVILGRELEPSLSVHAERGKIKSIVIFAKLEKRLQTEVKNIRKTETLTNFSALWEPKEALKRVHKI